VVEHAGERVAQRERLELAARLVELLGDLVRLSLARVATEDEADAEGRGDPRRERPAAERHDREDARHGEQ
jgi:hypothetical protein